MRQIVIKSDSQDLAEIVLARLTEANFETEKITVNIDPRKGNLLSDN